MQTWKIVYIDDSRLELKAVESALAEAGYTVVACTDGDFLLAEDLATADLVLIDYHLAGQTGQEVLAALRNKLVLIEREPPLFYLYTSDQEVGADYKEMGFNGRLILKGNQDALLRQLEAVQRAHRLRVMRPQ